MLPLDLLPVLWVWNQVTLSKRNGGVLIYFWVNRSSRDQKDWPTNVIVTHVRMSRKFLSKKWPCFALVLKKVSFGYLLLFVFLHHLVNHSFWECDSACDGHAYRVCTVFETSGKMGYAFQGFESVKTEWSLWKFVNFVLFRVLGKNCRLIS